VCVCVCRRLGAVYGVCVCVSIGSVVCCLRAVGSLMVSIPVVAVADHLLVVQHVAYSMQCVVRGTWQSHVGYSVCHEGWLSMLA
jgi:hypothetical protein